MGIEALTKAFGDRKSALEHASEFWAKEGKKDIFHHATIEKSPFGVFDKNKAANINTGSREGITGVNGLYVGKDPNALHNFYNLAAERGENIITYRGKPRLLDLTDNAAEKEFISRFKTGNQIEKELERMGFDGIKYFDPFSTGEEIVIINQKALTPVAFNGEPIKNSRGGFASPKTIAIGAGAGLGLATLPILAELASLNSAQKEQETISQMVAAGRSQEILDTIEALPPGSPERVKLEDLYKRAIGSALENRQQQYR